MLSNLTDEKIRYVMELDESSVVVAHYLEQEDLDLLSEIILVFH